MEFYSEDDFYKDKGRPTEMLAYCDYCFFVNSETEEYGRDYNQFALVTNSLYPYIRLTKKRGPHHSPCGGKKIISTKSNFASISDKERDEICPKIAWGLAAIIIFNLRYDDTLNEFVPLQELSTLFEEYYNRYYDIYISNHSGLKFSSITKEQMELNFISEHEEMTKRLWEKSEPLKLYSNLYIYAHETVVQYLINLQDQKRLFENMMNMNNSFSTEIRESPRGKYIKVFFLDDSVAAQAKIVVGALNSVMIVNITDSLSKAHPGKTLTVYLKPMVSVENSEKEIIDVLNKFFSNIKVGNMQVRNEAYFASIESRICKALDEARATICVCVAWFTNPKLRDKLLEKSRDGVDVRVIIYKDGVNASKGVDLSGIRHKEYRGERGGVMHDKFCVIDNVHTICGSYNWTQNAQNKNDEDTTFHLEDYKLASEYTRRFNQMWRRDGVEE